MANPSTGAGRLRIDFAQGTAEAAVDDIYKYLESECIFADSVDFEVYISETQSGLSIIMTAESGWDPGEFWESLEGLSGDDSSLCDEARSAMDASSLTGSCYDWDSGQRYIVIKKAGVSTCSLLAHIGVRMCWSEVVRRLRSDGLFNSGVFKNVISEATLSLVYEDRDQVDGACVYALSTQGLSGYLLIRGGSTECLLVDPELEACTAPEQLWERIDNGEIEPQSMDTVSNCSEAKDDLLSGLNMYEIVKGNSLSDEDIEVGMRIKYSIDEPVDDELAAVLARWS